MRTALAAVLPLALACNGAGDTSTIVPKPAEAGAPAGEAPADTAAARSEAPARPAGVPHHSAIDQVALTADGRTAVTRDAFGGVRLWITLDGSVEPRIVPLRGARKLSIAKHPDGWTIAAIDSAQAGRVVRATKAGDIAEIASLAPFDPVNEFIALPGGKRILALGRDATVRLYDDRGAELARLQKRSFRPERLFVAADGASAVAATMSRDSTGKTDGTFHRIAIGGGAEPELSIVGDEVSFATLLDPNLPVMSLSPNGKRLAYFNRNATGQTTEWFIVLVDLASGDEKNIASPIAVHFDPNLGFVDDDTLLAYTSRGATSWLIEVDEEDHVTPRPAPAANTSGNAAHAYSQRAFVASAGRWLYVQDIASRDERYLGYGFLQPNQAAMAPSGKIAAWVSTTNEVFVENLATGALVELEADWARNFGVQRLAFADDERLLAIDRVGGIRVIDWAEGKTLAEAGASGGVRDAEYLPELGLLRVTRNQNDTWVFELDNDELEGPYIVADAGWRGGLLMPEAAGDPVLWTLDSQGVYRSYTLDEIRRDRTHKETRDKDAKPANSDGTAPTAIGRDGARYYFGNAGGANTSVRIVDAGVEREIELSRQSPSLIVPSPDGERVLVTFNDGAVLAYDTESLDLQWSFSAQVIPTQLSWSDDGRRVAIAAQTGGAVLDAGDGHLVNARCAQDFEVRGTPPNQFFASSAGPSLCER